MLEIITHVRNEDGEPGRRVIMLTFLQFFRSHCLTPSSCARTSVDSKNFAFGPPSFFGPRVIIFYRIFSLKYNIDRPQKEFHFNRKHHN